MTPDQEYLRLFAHANELAEVMLDLTKAGPPTTKSDLRHLANVRKRLARTLQTLSQQEYADLRPATAAPSPIEET